MRLEVAIKKRLPEFEIKVAFSCEDGRLLALTGPSGAGKTTIIRCIAGLDQPDSGRINYNGHSWFDGQQGIMQATRKRGVGYVFQEHTLFPHLDIAANVAFACPDRARVDELLTAFGFSRLAGRLPHQVSGGERQRAALAQALASKPKVLLLDEPFSALDPETRQVLRRELKALKEQLALPIVMITHDQAEANYLADQQLAIRLGRPQEEASGHLLQNTHHCLAGG